MGERSERTRTDRGTTVARAPGRPSVPVEALIGALIGLAAACSSGGAEGPSTGGTGTVPLTVAPEGNFWNQGTVGGPFTPGSQEYELVNSSGSPIDWTAGASAGWVLLSATSGNLGVGGFAVLTVSLDQATLAAFAPGAYSATVTIVDQTNGDAYEREVDVLVVDAGGGIQASSISQFGITWTFDADHEVGQFVNGDWWVTGPATIVGISPASTTSPTSTTPGSRTKNGSMVNPSPLNGTTQGYDSHTYGQYRQAGHYSEALNVALGVSPSSPLVLPPHSSLVSTISDPAEGERPQVRAAAVLTVLPGPPPMGSFRPPYCGSDKTIRFNEGQLDYALLAKLAPVASTPSFATVEPWFERPWIDHVPGWLGGYTHPSENMEDYGRDIADQVGTAALMLHLNFTNARKRTLLIRLVQVGIDNYGVIRDGGEQNWKSSAGWMSGRKWPILFAGLMLSDPDMSQIGFDPTVEFGEDGQTFVVEETPPGSGVYNNGYGNYNASFVGLPEWGSAHTWKPWDDDSSWFGDPYRLCCTANAWWGQLLAAYIMGAKPLWNHDVLFDYQERYLTENLNRGITDWRLHWRDFYFDMWQTYRGNY